MPALVASALASGVALWLQNVLRDTWQIRTLPERVEEWLLLFVPLDLFERGLQQLGSDAKEVALFGTVVGMAALLFGLGVLALRAAWTSWWLLGLGVGMWLVAMAIVMPVTGAGFFATGLLIAPLLVNAGYLVVFSSYACVLDRRPTRSAIRTLEHRPTILAERRALLAGVVGTLIAGGIARLVGSQGGLVASSLPLAAVPTSPAAPHPVRRPPKRRPKRQRCRSGPGTTPDRATERRGGDAHAGAAAEPAAAPASGSRQGRRAHCRRAPERRARHADHCQRRFLRRHQKCRDGPDCRRGPVAAGDRRRSQSPGAGRLPHAARTAGRRSDQDARVHLELHRRLQPDQLWL